MKTFYQILLFLTILSAFFNTDKSDNAKLGHIANAIWAVALAILIRFENNS